MSRSTIKDWHVESIFRDLQRRGIKIEDNEWLASKYLDFQQKEDQSLRSHPIFTITKEKRGVMHGDFEYFPDPSQEGPACSMLEIVVRANLRDAE